MADLYLNQFFAVWIELAVLLDVIAVGIGFQLAAARGVFSLARDGCCRTPLVEARTASSCRSSAASRSSSSPWSRRCIMLAKWGTDLVDPAGPDLFFNTKVFNGGFVGSTVIGGILICFVYLLVCVGALKLFATEEPARPRSARCSAWPRAASASTRSSSNGTTPVGSPSCGVVTVRLILVGVARVWAGAARRKSAIDKVAQHTVHHA